VGTRDLNPTCSRFTFREGGPHSTSAAPRGRCDGSCRRPASCSPACARAGWRRHAPGARPRCPAGSRRSCGRCATPPTGNPAAASSSVTSLVVLFGSRRWPGGEVNTTSHSFGTAATWRARSRATSHAGSFPFGCCFCSCRRPGYATPCRSHGSRSARAARTRPPGLAPTSAAHTPRRYGHPAPPGRRAGRPGLGCVNWGRCRRSRPRRHARRG
jgi:hypothetical protein